MPHKDPERARAYKREWDLKNQVKRKAYYASWKARNRDHVNGYNSEWCKRNRDKVNRWVRTNPEKYLLSRTKSRAKTLGIPFNLTIDDIVIPERCPCLGTILRRGVGQGHAHSPSVDRIDPSMGYVKGNVWVISKRANTIKNDATPAELLAVAAAVIAKRNSAL